MDKLDQLLADVAGSLETVEALRGTRIFKMAPEIDSDGQLITVPALMQNVKNALQGLTPRNGKVGTVIVIFPPEQVPLDHKSNSAQVPCEASLVIQCAENLTLNNGSDGTKLSCPEVANLIFQHLRFYPATAGALLKADDRHGMHEVSTKDGSRLMEQVFRCVWNRDKISRCEAPRLTVAGTLLSLSSATADAVILYTTDGTFPSPENATTQTWTAPVDISGILPFTLRAIATKTGLGASIPTQAALT